MRPTHELKQSGKFAKVLTHNVNGFSAEQPTARETSSAFAIGPIPCGHMGNIRTTSHAKNLQAKKIIMRTLLHPANWPGCS